MLSVRQLSQGIDSLERRNEAIGKKVKTDLESLLYFNKLMDSGWKKVNPPVTDAKTVSDLLPDSVQRQVLDQSISYASSIKNSLQISAMEYNSQREQMRLQLIEWHYKFTMALAVFVLFLIGAPLGSIVRKGGIGTPVVFAVIFFVIFFLLNNFGKKFVKEDLVRPVSGMWMATFILVPIGLFLTYKAMHDSQLMNKEFYFRFFRKFKTFIQSRRKVNQEDLT